MIGNFLNYLGIASSDKCDERNVKEVRKSHKKQAFGKASCGWCQSELVRGMGEAIRLKKFSYKKIYPAGFKGNKVPRSTLAERLKELAEERHYASFAEMMERAPDEEIFLVSNEAVLEKMKCTQMRNRGMKRFLTVEQEMVLATFLNYISIDGASLDYDIIRLWLHELLITAWNVNLFENGEISRGWYRGFLERHPFIKERKGRTVEDCRLFAEATIVPFFNQICKRMEGVDPRLIGNLDEAMCSAVDNHTRVVGSSLATVARRKGMESQKPHISILPVTNAAGELLVALIVEGSANKNRIPHVPVNYLQDKKFHYSATKSGFIEMELYENFMINTVVRSINEMREREGLVGQTFYLFLDNLPAHRSENVAAKLLESDIVQMFFPVHTSHIVQPSDRGIFHVLKRGTAKALFHHHTLCGTAPNIGTRVELISKTFYRCVTKTVIQNSYLHAGIYPLNLQRAKDAMDGRYRHGMEHAPPEVLREDEVEAAHIWGNDADHVLSVQENAIHHDGIVTMTSINKRGTVKCSVYTSSNIIRLSREARDAFKTICERAQTVHVPNNPMEFYFSDDPRFIEQNQFLQVKRTIMKMKWRTEIVPILCRMEGEGIEEIIPVLESTELVPAKREELIEIMTERFEAFLYFFDCPPSAAAVDEEDEGDEDAEMWEEQDLV